MALKSGIAKAIVLLNLSLDMYEGDFSIQPHLVDLGYEGFEYKNNSVVYKTAKSCVTITYSVSNSYEPDILRIYHDGKNFLYLEVERSNGVTYSVMNSGGYSHVFVKFLRLLLTEGIEFNDPGVQHDLDTGKKHEYMYSFELLADDFSNRIENLDFIIATITNLKNQGHFNLIEGLEYDIDTFEHAMAMDTRDRKKTLLAILDKHGLS